MLLKPLPETWAVVELMGHVKLAGRLTEEEKFGAKMGRLDIPTTERCDCPNAGRTSVESPTVECSACHGAGFIRGFVTQYFGGGSVYRITYVTEDVARHCATSNSPAPVHPWDFPKALPAAPPVDAPSAGAADLDGEDDELADAIPATHQDDF